MKRFKHILMYAGTERTEAAISRAVTLAMENDARLTLMDVVKRVPRALSVLSDAAEPEEIEQLLRQDHQQKLLKIASEYIDTGVSIDTVVTVGDPATEIVRRVLSDQHDLVIKCADGMSSAGRLFGSVARSLLRICPCPLWILKPEIHGEFDRVLAAVDMESNDQAHGDLNREIFGLAASIAARENAQLDVVTAWDVWMENALRRRSGDVEIDTLMHQHEQQVRDRLHELLQTSENAVQESQCHVLHGQAAPVVRSVADRLEADLLVMGTVCRTGAAGFLIGNTAETILADVTCSILALKPEGFISPIEMATETNPLTEKFTA